MPRVVADRDSGLSEEHFSPNSFVGEDLLVGEADARTGKVVLVSGGRELIIVIFVSGSENEFGRIR